MHDPGQEADTVQTCLFSLLSMGHLMPPTTQESWFIIIMLILMKFKLIQDQCGCSDTTTKSSKKSRWRTSCHDSQKKEYKCKQTKVANGQAISKPAWTGEKTQMNKLISKARVKAREIQEYIQQFSCVTGANADARLCKATVWHLWMVCDNRWKSVCLIRILVIVNRNWLLVILLTDHWMLSADLALGWEPWVV